jgi:outer membrane protein, multidrug efflux system
MNAPRYAPLTAVALAALLAGCAALPGTGTTPSRDVPALAAPATPASWQAPLPHDGNAADLTRWWQQFDDPLLAPLIESAQAASPNVASAGARIAQARANRVAAGASQTPTLELGASASRGRQVPEQPLANNAAVGLQAAWELDLFGANRAGRGAAQARLEGAQAQWHDARVAVAAEVANAYIALRACEALAAKTRLDADSRQETARLTGLAARAGFQAPADATLAGASAAQARALLVSQQAQCDLDVKALVALTGEAEPTLRNRLAAATARVPTPAGIAVTEVPAQALAQRPDLFNAEREVLAASNEVAQQQAQRLPRIALAGNIGAARLSTGAGSSDGLVWTLGPVSVSLPIFDGGTRRANVEAARARYDEAVALYRARLRGAVREVEEALVNLQSSSARAADTQAAADGYDAGLRATEARFRSGLASLFELEDARRNAVQGRAALIALQRDRSSAWIALYRALGGGWSPSDAATASR